ncbi:hypothetical protein LCC91_07890 [Tepidimonas taiwanensis]|uniref:Uncharacterized protein n=1 Tax=Tepidimonas taiwanensis TaxID=307486 RepID=A0A554XAV4_9BURK|nr:hypothetical protein [Tepidimonas taiwanensis]TSE32970.1 hypothetical protein Ttaiw_00831 [Tepidimonas taiwanensis]UBQ04496.1 hypothetical protein LCC91_07890 [Tepidimonas taiwanensis]
MSTERLKLGNREEDYLVRLSPFDWSLREVGRIQHQGREYVILRHALTGDLYARDISADYPRLIRAFANNHTN